MAGSRLRVLVVTVAHRGDDARIVHREAQALLAAGHEVVLIAPDPGPASRERDPEGLERVDVPRATGRRRVGSWRAARRAVSRHGRRSDVVIVHDPELVPVLGWTRGSWRRAALIWDVHEDYVASVPTRRYLPSWSHRPLQMALGGLERLARTRFTLIAAEDAYRDRLGDVVVIPNSAVVPKEPAPYRDPPRVVYVGRLSLGRGVAEMIALARRLHEEHLARLVLVGAADAEVGARLDDAVAEGILDWTGPLPSPDALEVVRGALAGLSLLHDEANYRISRPTKCVEYLAAGVPVITTPLPLAAELVEMSGGGVVLSAFTGDEVVEECLIAIRTLVTETNRRRDLGRHGHAYVAVHHDWGRGSEIFVGHVESVAGGPRSR